ncbi:hypothetical protein ACP4OV_016576 [Aristida adscensionis]
MDAFDGARFVRLRSVGRGTKYLAADTDGWSVCISGQRGTYSTVWGVQPIDGPDGAECVLLRSVYGRYLFATESQAGDGSGPAAATVVRQGILHDTEEPTHLLRGFQWQALPRRGSLVLQNVRADRYLRANGRYCRWRRAATAALEDAGTMVLWAIEVVPLAVHRPTINDPVRQLRHRFAPPPLVSRMTRLLRYVVADSVEDIDMFDDDSWGRMTLQHNNLRRLRLALQAATGHEVADTTVCIQAGPYGQLTPLLIDLPIDDDRIDVAIVRLGTEADGELEFPQLDGPFE